MPDLPSDTARRRKIEAEQLKQLLAQHGGTVLVVGARSINFPDAYRKNPRITIWDAIEDHDHERPPHNTRAIICLRFISHPLYSKLNRFRHERQAFMINGLSTTAEIKAILATALDIAPDTEAQAFIDASSSATPLDETPPPEPSPSSQEEPRADTGHDAPPAPDIPASTEGTDMALRAPERGELRELITNEMDTHAASIAEEARRLVEVAKKKGIKTTANSIAQGIYTMRNEAAKNGHGKRATAAATPKKRERATAETDDQTVLALKIITDISEQLDNLQDIVLKLQQDQKKIAGLREYLGKL